VTTHNNVVSVLSLHILCTSPVKSYHAEE